MTVKLVTGDDFKRSATLTDLDNNTGWAVTGGTLKAAIVSSDYKTQLCSEVTLNAAATGADWASGIIIIDIPQATTGEIAQHVRGAVNAFVAVQVELSGVKKTLHAPIQIIQGHIA